MGDSEHGGAAQGPGALFRAGQLGPAVDAASAAVRKAPRSLEARVLLAELLLFTGRLDRADVILDAASTAEPSAALVIAEFRQLLRADTARRQVRRDGRVPDFLGEPTPAQQALLAGLIALRENNAEEAALRASEAETLRPRVPGTAAGTAFDDFRDLDDLCAGNLEVLTTTGKCYWIPTERVASIAFHAPQRARDLVWRRATVSVHDGPDGDVYLPALYDAEEPEMDDALRLGRATDWRSEQHGTAQRSWGIGQRTFLVGEDAVGIMDLTTLQFG